MKKCYVVESFYLNCKLNVTQDHIIGYINSHMKPMILNKYNNFVNDLNPESYEND